MSKSVESGFECTTMAMNRKRGGQPKHWARISRVLAWYRVIRLRSGWLNPQLDEEFAWKSREKQQRQKDRRPRIFEGIERNARAPKHHPDFRSLDELVLAVASVRPFTGTKELYHARIWNLFERETLSVEELISGVNALLEKYELIQEWPPYSPEVEQLLNQQEFHLVADYCMRYSMREMHDYDKLEFAWYLYVASEPASCWPLRAKFKITLENLLERFFNRYFPDSPFEMQSLAIEEMVKVRLALADSPAEEYRRAEVFCQTLIFPKILRGTLSWERLTSIILFEEIDF